MVSGITFFVLATLLVGAFRYLEHVKHYKGIGWSLLRLASALSYLCSAIHVGSYGGFDIGNLRIVYQPGAHERLFDEIPISLFYLGMAVASLISAYLVELIFFKKYVYKPVDSNGLSSEQ
jgi:hypothetical protein